VEIFLSTSWLFDCWIAKVVCAYLAAICLSALDPDGSLRAHYPVCPERSLDSTDEFAALSKMTGSKDD
jgi:hypothetical protein